MRGGRPAGALKGTGQGMFNEPDRDASTALSLPVLGGVVQLRDLVADYGGVDVVAKDFRLGMDLLERYLSGQLDAPYSLFCALWWQTSHGFQQAFAESHWTHQFNSFRRREAESKVRHLEVVVGHAIALLEHRADAAELVRQSLAVVQQRIEAR